MIAQTIYTYEPATTKNKNRSLLFFFSGWGMDINPFLEYAPGKRDVIICYDYRSLHFNEKILNPYTDIKVVAWSMGVWAASQVLTSMELPVSQSIAVNGTIYPVDNNKGIPNSVFTKTLKGLNSLTLNKFRRRMCGTTPCLERFLTKAPQRPEEELKQELKFIGEKSAEWPPRSFRWDVAYIGKNDKIFTLENQVNAWQGNKIRITDSEHYPEELWHELFETRPMHPKQTK